MHYHSELVMKNVLQVHFNKRLQQLDVIRLSNKKELKLPVLRIICRQTDQKKQKDILRKYTLYIFVEI